MNKFRRGDMVKVISGSEAGKTGEVLSVQPDSSTVTVKGIAVAKRHKKGEVRGGGEILEKERPIHWSKVMLLSGNSPAKVHFLVTSDKKERVLKARG